MICKNCGKEFDGKENVCKDCQTQIKKSLKGNRTDKLTVGVSSTIISGASISIATFALYLCALSILVTFTDLLGNFGAFLLEYATPLVLLSIACLPVSFALALISLSLGLGCISFYKSADLEKRKRPIPTLVTGILAVSGAVLAFMITIVAVAGCICYFVL